MLNHIFNPSDLIFTTDSAQNNKGFRVSRAQDVVPTQFYAINPVANPDLHYPRLRTNVAKYLNFLLEMDEGSLKEQRAIIERLKQAGYAPSLVTFSGGKSHHLIYSAQEPLPFKPTCVEGADAYKQAARSFMLQMEHILNFEYRFDNSTIDPLRLSRMPGSFRGEVEQTLVEVGPLYPAETFLRFEYEATSFVLEHLNESALQNVDITTALLRNPELKPLKNKFLYAHLWARSEGNYYDLFKYTLWLLEKTKANYASIKNFMDKEVYPFFAEKNYPKERFDKAVQNAYTYKVGRG